MFQDTHNKWMNNNPFIYYPFQPDIVSQSVHHQLRTNAPPPVIPQATLNFCKTIKFYFWMEKLNRTFYMDTIYTTDNQQVLYTDLCSNTKLYQLCLT